MYTERDDGCHRMRDPPPRFLSEAPRVRGARHAPYAGAGHGARASARALRRVRRHAQHRVPLGVETRRDNRHGGDPKPSTLNPQP